MNTLTVKNLKKSVKESFFSSRKFILKNVSFDISAKAGLVGFLGANGSGKTTTLKCVLGLMKRDEGESFFFGDNTLSKKVLKRVGFLPENPCFYRHLTGEELLLFYGSLCLDLKRADILSKARSLLKQLDMYSVKDTVVQTYSKGMLQKIGIAQALIHEPDLVFLDEPMSGLDPDSRLYVGELLQNLTYKGVNVFFSSHLLHDVERLCDNVVVLKNGKTVFSDSLEKLLEGIKGERKVVYIEKNKQNTVLVSDLKNLQKVIDGLRKRNCLILSVQLNNISLEKAFSNWLFSVEG